MNHLLRLLLIVCTFACSASAQVTLPSLFSDHMVLQRGVQVPIWGKAKPGEKITVEFAGKTANATADESGKWVAKLPPLTVGDAASLTIKPATGEPIVFKDVLVGDVWICSGQSNMDMNVKSSNNPEEEIQNANYPNIRLFAVPHVVSINPKSDPPKANWEVCTPKTIANFSAVGYFFARDLREKENIPIGLIKNAWGGMPAESFTSKEALEADPDFKVLLDRKADPSTQDVARGKQRFERDKQIWEGKYLAKDPGNKGFDQGFAKPDLDEADWKPIELPGHWEKSGLKIDGGVWFRRKIEIPQEWAGKPIVIHLGGIDDFDTTYFNGEKIGATGGNDLAVFVQRAYTVPTELAKPGEAVIAVRVWDRMGPGGFYGQPMDMKLAIKGDETIKPLSLAGEWHYKVEHSIDQPESIPPMPQPPAGADAPFMASNIYNAMVHPLAPYAIKGAIWYQGESNATRAVQYRKLFPAMISDWRKLWGQGDFPFLFVQLANFKERKSDPADSDWAELREAQTMTLDKLPNTGMAVIIDIGDAKDIHPKNKQDVGKRLALAAEKIAYGKELEYSGPIYDAMKVEENKARITFKHSKGLKAKDGAAVKGFAIAGEDKKFVWADAKIDGETVVVSAEGIEKPAAVRYGWADNPEVNLYNGADLPASPFRTDDWPAITAATK